MRIPTQMRPVSVVLFQVPAGQDGRALEAEERGEFTRLSEEQGIPDPRHFVIGLSEAQMNRLRQTLATGEPQDGVRLILEWVGDRGIHVDGEAYSFLWSESEHPKFGSIHVVLGIPAFLAEFMKTIRDDGISL